MELTRQKWKWKWKKKRKSKDKIREILKIFWEAPANLVETVIQC